MAAQVLLFLALLAGPQTNSAPGSPPAAGRFLLAGARVLSPAGDAWLDDVVVVVEGETIAAVEPASTIEWTPADRILDLSGTHLVPGLIDLHTHLLLHPYDEAEWEQQVLKEPLELRTIRGVTAARATLRAGFTTIRDLGTEGAGWADVALRQAIAEGLIPGPRVLAATRALVTTGGYGPFGFDPRFDVPKGAQVADGPDGVRVATREQIAAGADWIKVYADYRRAPEADSTPTFSRAELEAIVDEARSAGVPVAAHASTDAAIRRAAEAGVSTIEHGTYASRATLELLRDRGVAWCPTLTAIESIATYRGWTPADPEPDRMVAARATFAAALEVGVTIACGSDVGVFDHGDNARELELLVEFGLTPAAALQAATSTAARVLGLEDELGSIMPGLQADLVVLRDDPLETPRALRAPALVLQRGRVVAGDLLQRRGDPGAPGEALAACRAMLTAYSEKRFDEARSWFAPDAVVAMDFGTAERRSTTPIAAFLERGRVQLRDVGEFREWLGDDAEIRVDGAIATVWAPFVLVADERVALGTDAFQLIELDGSWRIVAASFTNRPLR